MFISGNPIDDFYDLEIEKAEWLKSLPLCTECDEPIQDDFYYVINSETLCEECMKEKYQKVNFYSDCYEED